MRAQTTGGPRPPKRKPDSSSQGLQQPPGQRRECGENCAIGSKPRAPALTPRSWPPARANAGSQCALGATPFGVALPEMLGVDGHRSRPGRPSLRRRAAAFREPRVAARAERSTPISFGKLQQQRRDRGSIASPGIGGRARADAAARVRCVFDAVCTVLRAAASSATNRSACSLRLSDARELARARLPGSVSAWPPRREARRRRWLRGA